MEMKIVCDCGQKYAFDVEPVNGRMPATVNCPACGGDGTHAANDILSQIFPDQPPPIPVAIAVEPAAALAPPPPFAAAAPVGGLRINRAAPAPMTATAGESPLPAAPVPIAAMRSPGIAAASAKPKLEKEYNIGLGILGAFLGAALGTGLMFGFYALTDFRFPLMGMCIGILTGLGARLLARGTDMSLGGIAGAIAFLATGGTLYFMFGEFSIGFLISMAVSVSLAFKIVG
jgi:hypothetical protein